MPKILLQHNLPKADLRPSRVSALFEGERGCPLQTRCCDDQKAPGDAGTTAFALLSEKIAGASNLPVCRSYLQRQPCTTLVCMGLRLLMSASPDRVIRI